jgi:hypothetical protein
MIQGSMPRTTRPLGHRPRQAACVVSRRGPAHCALDQAVPVIDQLLPGPFPVPGPFEILLRRSSCHHRRLSWRSAAEEALALKGSCIVHSPVYSLMGQLAGPINCISRCSSSIAIASWRPRTSSRRNCLCRNTIATNSAAMHAARIWGELHVFVREGVLDKEFGTTPD